MGDQLVILVVGFLLTSIVGGGLGYFFQNRSWKRQNDERLRENERSAALRLFDELSMLMDRRLYRMRRLLWQFDDEQGGAGAVEARLQEYRDVLTEWNDQLNRNLALAATYFGPHVREELDLRIYEEFKAVGRLIERSYRGDAAAIAEAHAALDRLSDSIYSINVRMIARIQRGDVGMFLASRVHDEPAPQDEPPEGASVSEPRST